MNILHLCLVLIGVSACSAQFRGQNFGRPGRYSEEGKQIKSSQSNHNSNQIDQSNLQSNQESAKPDDSGPKKVGLTISAPESNDLLNNPEKVSLTISASESNDLLNNPELITETVDCIIDYDPSTCDPRLKIASEMAPLYFSKGECRNCKREDTNRLKKFIRKMQRKHRREYQRLILTLGAI